MIVIGTCEWVGLPELAIDKLRARVDTGAKTSSLHASDIRALPNDEIEFNVYVGSPKTHRMQPCRAKVVGERIVQNPGGRRERRPVITTTLSLGGRSWPIELNLTDRRDMRFRMLLGRSTLSHHCLVDPGHTYMQSRHGRYAVSAPEKKT